ncbi:unnamed protein product [Prorocentrum cordatum]|uniref:Acyltransferase 3 domain-containing protein n=1 Tax=Prorocentrum cordatum TaxID=2364126 RepID=A0ABN9SQL2_9DINO|nr:unnamed protein product [Polarella glacialis]
MPLFFYAFGNVAGKSGNKSRSCAETLRKSSSLRLFLPFLFFCLTFAPAMQYFDEEEKIDPSNPGIFHLKKNPVTWLWRFYTSSGLGKLWIFGKLDLAWLWFLPAFWVVEILSIPLFGFAERRPRWEIYCAGASVLWLGLAVLLVTCFRFSLQFALFAVAGPVCTALLTCKWPLPPYNLMPSRDTKEAKRAWIAIRVAKAIQIACNVGLVTSFGYECLDWQGGACVEGQEGIDWQGGKCVISTDSNITYAQCVKQEDCHYQWPRDQRNSYEKGYLREAVPFISLCLGFYVQGFFSQRWFRSAQYIDDIRKMPSFKFKSYRLLGFFLVAIGIMGTSTLGGVEADHYTYPIYSNTYCKGPYFGAIFVIGTWVFLSWIYPLAKAYVNCKINAWLHHYAKNSCLVVYGVHWLWLKIFVFWMVEPSVRYCKEPWSILSLFGHCPDPESGYENPLATVGILFMAKKQKLHRHKLLEVRADCRGRR